MSNQPNEAINLQKNKVLNPNTSSSLPKNQTSIHIPNSNKKKDNSNSNKSIKKMPKTFRFDSPTNLNRNNNSSTKVKPAKTIRDTEQAKQSSSLQESNTDKNKKLFSSTQKKHEAANSEILKMSSDIKKEKSVKDKDKSGVKINSSFNGKIMHKNNLFNFHSKQNSIKNSPLRVNVKKPCEKDFNHIVDGIVKINNRNRNITTRSSSQNNTLAKRPNFNGFNSLNNPLNTSRTLTRTSRTRQNTNNLSTSMKLNNSDYPLVKPKNQSDSSFSLTSQSISSKMKTNQSKIESRNKANSKNKNSSKNKTSSNNLTKETFKTNQKNMKKSTAKENKPFSGPSSGIKLNSPKNNINKGILTPKETNSAKKEEQDKLNKKMIKSKMGGSAKLIVGNYKNLSNNNKTNNIVHSSSAKMAKRAPQTQPSNPIINPNPKNLASTKNTKGRVLKPVGKNETENKRRLSHEQVREHFKSEHKNENHKQEKEEEKLEIQELEEEKKNDKVFKRIRCMHDMSKTGKNGDEIKVNQDSYFIFKNFNNDYNKIYMGVCDGHGFFGNEVSSFIRENLAMDLNHLLNNKHLNSTNDDISPYIRQTFLRENRLLNENIDTKLSGSTCVSVIYSPEKLIIANIGDSRCVLGKKKYPEKNTLLSVMSEKNNNEKNHTEGNVSNYTFENLSRDHKPTLEDERERIRKAGGRIRPMLDDDGKTFIGPLRVYMKDKEMPGLAMTRSFGDAYAATAGTICEPEITEHVFEEEDKFIILASDGLFEFVSSQEVVDFVKEYYEKNDIVGACEFLYSESKRRWLLEDEDNIDDITIIIVFFE